jgi:flavodoxin
MSNRTLIVCMSVHHDNTLRIARAMSEPLNAEICSPEHLSPAKVSDYDLIGFGSGIYFGRFHSALRRWIDELPEELCRSRKVFLFSTSGLARLWCLWHFPMRSRLRQKGFEIVGEFHSSGFDTVGPLCLVGGLNRRHPDERDLDNAATFARQLFAQTTESEDPATVPLD